MTFDNRQSPPGEMVLASDNVVRRLLESNESVVR